MSGIREHRTPIVQGVVVLLAIALALLPAAPRSVARTHHPAARTHQPAAPGASSSSDVVVYCGTPGGVLAAVAAARAGLTVALVEPSQHVGGMMSNGLGATDIGNPATLGGYTREFFDRVQAAEGTVAGRYRFEPHVAERVFNDMLSSARVAVYLGQVLDPASVVKRGTRIVSFRSTSGHLFVARVFIDASYAGDLMAAAGVSFTVGREAASTYHETLAGVRPAEPVLSLPPSMTADPGISGSPPPSGPAGSGDARIEDADYRPCFSSDPANQVPFARPAGYSRSTYAVVSLYFRARALRTHRLTTLSWELSIIPVAHRKFDVSPAGPVSLALTGADYGWPLADPSVRAQIAARHEAWDRGLLYFLRTDPSVPARVRSQMAGYGLCKDEFTDNGNWPRQLYVREGRRMIGSYVLTQADVLVRRTKPDAVGVASYRIDSHPVSRWVNARGQLVIEGVLQAPYRQWEIPYRALTPRRSQVTNLLVVCAISASHVAYSSFRMEPQFMLAGEAAGTAAGLALSGGSGQIDVQAISIRDLQVELHGHGTVLSLSGPSSGAAPG